MRKLLLVLSFLSFSHLGNAQNLKPIQWTFETKKTALNEYDLIFKAKLDKNWHIFSQFMPGNDGPVKTSFMFVTDKGYERIGEVKELSKAVEKNDKSFGMKVKYYDKEAIFVQHIKLTAKIEPIQGVVNFMSCDDSKCLPPQDVSFSFKVPYENTVHE